MARGENQCNWQTTKIYWKHIVTHCAIGVYLYISSHLLYFFFTHIMFHLTYYYNRKVVKHQSAVYISLHVISLVQGNPISKFVDVISCLIWLNTIDLDVVSCQLVLSDAPCDNIKPISIFFLYHFLFALVFMSTCI